MCDASFCAGQVTLDKEPRFRTVVNKTDQIDSTFRFFKMEVLAGEDDLIANVRENGCTFTFDFSTVYWNSRLGKEHWRLVDTMKEGDVVLDMFAGVGPFAVLAAKRKNCIVHANDLNPDSYRYLKENAQKNGVSSRLKAYNMDGREFLLSVIKQLLAQSSSGSNDKRAEVCSHVIMNLPASSVEFLDAFQGLFSDIPEGIRPCIELPLVHCYCFVKCECESQQEEAALEKVSSKLGVSPAKGSSLVEIVRSVAPKKVMVRVSFKLPEQVAYRVPAALGDAVVGPGTQAAEEPASKYLKLDRGGENQ